MAIALTGRIIAGSYKDLLQVYNGNQGIDSTLRRISDGEGTDSSALISTNKFQIRPASNGIDTFEVVNSSGSVIFQINTTSNKVVLPSGVTIEGDGSALTGVLSAGVGGASSTGNLEVLADSDSSGSGDIIFKIGTKEVARIPYSYASSLPTGVAGNYFVKTIADNWGNPKGGAILNGTTQYYSVADNDNLSFGSSNFSFESFFRINSLASKIGFLSKDDGSGNREYNFEIETTGQLRSVYFDSNPVNFTVLQSATGVIEVGKDYHYVVVYNSGTFYVYLNNVLLTITRTNIGTGFSTFANGTKDFRIGNYSTSYLNGYAIYTRLYNRALTQSEVTKLYNNGRPDLAELDYADKGASNTNLVTNGTFDADANWNKGSYWAIGAGVASFTNTGNSALSQTGVLSVGKIYNLTFTVSADANITFTDGASNLISATTYTAGTHTVRLNNVAGTALTIIGNASGNSFDLDNVVLIRVGCVAEYKGENFGAMGLIDSSGNGLHGTSSGNPIALGKKKDFYKTVSTTAVQLVNTQKAGTILKQVKIKNITGSALTASLSTLNTLIATTSANNTLLNAVSVGANETKIFNIGDSAYSYASALRSLYVISSVATSLEVTLIYEEIE